MSDPQYAADREVVNRIRNAMNHARQIGVPLSAAMLYASPDVIESIRRAMIPPGYQPPFGRNPITAMFGAPVVQTTDQGEGYIEFRWSVRG